MDGVLFVDREQKLEAVWDWIWCLRACVCYLQYIADQSICSQLCVTLRGVTTEDSLCLHNSSISMRLHRIVYSRHSMWKGKGNKRRLKSFTQRWILSVKEHASLWGFPLVLASHVILAAAPEACAAKQQREAYIRHRDAESWAVMLLYFTGSFHGNSRRSPYQGSGTVPHRYSSLNFGIIF